MLKEEELSGTEKKVFAALKKVIDPELQVDLVDLGLIYGIEVKDEKCQITMTLTIMGCPLTQVLHDRIYKAVLAIPGIKDLKIKVVWYPQWQPSMMTRLARITLGVHL